MQTLTRTRMHTYTQATRAHTNAHHTQNAHAQYLHHAMESRLACKNSGKFT